MPGGTGEKHVLQAYVGAQALTIHCTDQHGGTLCLTIDSQAMVKGLELVCATILPAGASSSVSHILLVRYHQKWLAWTQGNVEIFRSTHLGGE